jgi:hypothetical protein
MSVYTVYEPPLRAGEIAPDPDRFVFVREGFYFWAFVLAPLWMLWHRMWLVLFLYLVIVAGFENAAYYAGIGTLGAAVVQLALSILVGLEAGTLRRFTLSRRGFRNAGIVVGDDLESAEQRFFNAWVEAASGRRAAPAAVSPAPVAAVSRVSQSSPASDIVGLFPEPGASG